jgi:hypothetical protein
MIHPQIIAAGQDGCWSGVRIHGAHKRSGVFLKAPRVSDPFIEDSSQPGKVKTARHLQSPFLIGPGAGPLGPASNSCFPTGLSRTPGPESDSPGPEDGWTGVTVGDDWRPHMKDRLRSRRSGRAPDERASGSTEASCFPAGAWPTTSPRRTQGPDRHDLLLSSARKNRGPCPA